MTREELLKVAKPILFNTEMVRAILDGNKTVTRRAIKLDLGLAGTDKLDSSYLYIPDEYGDYHDAKDLCRYQKGDCIYVRETFRYVSIGEVTYEGECIWEEDVVQFKASEEEFDEKYRGYIGEYEKWRPSIHMPKELARIFLKVSDVRVERLQDVTEEQAEKEGAETEEFLEYMDWADSVAPVDVPCTFPTVRDNFAKIWDSTVSKKDFDKYDWESNPFVWVIEFERVLPK